MPEPTPEELHQRDEDQQKTLDKVSGWEAFIKTPIGIAVSGLLIAFLGAATAFFVDYSKNGSKAINLPVIQVRVIEMPAATPQPGVAPVTSPKLDTPPGTTVNKVGD